jgi:hypothetical protein
MLFSNLNLVFLDCQFCVVPVTSIVSVTSLSPDQFLNTGQKAPDQCPDVRKWYQCPILNKSIG